MPRTKRSAENNDPEERARKQRYYEQVEASDGFDVDHFPKSMSCGMLHKVPASDMRHVRKLAILAINKYNDDNGSKYKVVKVEKANAQGCGWQSYKITFDAKEIDAEPKTFQACVLQKIPVTDIEVKFCRLKPSNS